MKLHLIVSRIAAAFIFGVFGVWEVVQPAYWIGFVPNFLSTAINPIPLVIVHGIVLTLVGIAFVGNRYVKFAAIVATLLMLQIIIFLFAVAGFNEILVRDMSIMLFTASFIFLPKQSQ
jgi:hypothetical protein